LQTNMLQPQIRVEGDFGRVCSPDACGNATIPQENPTLTLQHTFTTAGTYLIQVDNYDTGGDFTLDFVITSDSAACNTWAPNAM